MQLTSKSTLPFMKTMDDALAVCQRENDNFYLTAFMIEAWLGSVTLETVAEYAEKKSAADRRLQQGTATRIFNEIFGHASDHEIHHVFNSLNRFAEYSDPQSRVLLRTYGIMAVEHPVSTWPKLVPPVIKADIDAAAAFMRATMHRIADWVEAITHAQMHLFSHFAPVAFDPDPEKRELAIIGVQQRRYPEMDDFQKAWWEWHHGEAAERLQNPAKWVMVGRGLADDQTRHHTYPILDDGIIMLWPLVLRFNWTFRDLMMVLRSVDRPWRTYPCEREQDLATYCSNVLGLRKGQKGRSAKNGLPEGIEIARALCRRDDSSVS
jgi:hypothetical protein